MLDTTDEFDAPADEDVQTTDTTQAAEIVADQPPADPEPVHDAPTDEDKPSSKREAKYRIQLRVTEAERDQLRATVETLQRAEAERIAAKTIKTPAGLWAAGTALDDLLGDDGNVDPAKVEAAVTSARASLGLDRAWRAPHVPREGTGTNRDERSGNTWEQAFKV